MFSSLVIYRQENQILEFTFLDYEWSYFFFFFLLGFKQNSASFDEEQEKEQKLFLIY